jgi:hypothetical protein
VLLKTAFAPVLFARCTAASPHSRWPSLPLHTHAHYVLRDRPTEHAPLYTCRPPRRAVANT